MKKEQVVELKERKEERFHRQKQSLVYQLEEFFAGSLTPSKVREMNDVFYNRITYRRKDMEGFFQFWMYFFYRYDNGLRGIEWFWKEMGNRLSTQEAEMAKRWLEMKPRFLTAIEEKDEVIVYEDYRTGETFPCAKDLGTTATQLAWSSTVALLEPLGDVYYFNGLRMFQSPNKLQKAYEHVDALAEDAGKEFDEAVMEAYPDILEIFLTNAYRSREEVPISTYTYTFRVKESTSATSFLMNEPDVFIENQGVEEVQFSWVKNWLLYKDNEAAGDIQLGEVYAKLTAKDGFLTAVLYTKDYQDTLLEKMNDNSLEYLGMEEEVIGYGPSVTLSQNAIYLQEGVPEYFIPIAQTALTVDLDVEIPTLGNKSLRESVAQGETEKVEWWLRGSEYNEQYRMLEEFGHLTVTPDYNTIRRKLGMPLSPFVTGGEKRQSSIQPIQMKDPNLNYIIEGEVSYYQDLGITPETKDAFYARDLVLFFKEKVQGKSQATYRKYRASLYDIRILLEVSGVGSWEECDEAFWCRYVVEELVDMYYMVSPTHMKEMISVIKAFVKWLDDHKNLGIYHDVARYFKEHEAEIFSKTVSVK